MSKKIQNVFKLIPVNLIFADRYQRRYEEIYKRAKEMAQNYKENEIGAIKVSFRDGKYYVFDGQHRLLATKMVGLFYIMCEIFTGLTYEQEAEAFYRFGTNSKPITACQNINARLESKEEKVLKINDIANIHGYTIATSHNVKSLNRIRSVSCIESIVDKYGLHTLDKVLLITSRCWYNTIEGVSSDILNGLAYFIKNNKFDELIFIKQLSKVDVKIIVREAKSDLNNKAEMAMQTTFKNYYNKNNRKNKI
jgi:hypothetical protein